MKNYIKDGAIFMLILFITISCIISSVLLLNYYKVPDRIDTIYVDRSYFSEENLIYWCDKFEIVHTDIVIAQARLETGNYTSDLFIRSNNLFGLVDIKGSYYIFSHWIESVAFYKNRIQNKYSGCKLNKEEYYSFLVKLPYAKDIKYINKLRMFNIQIN